jgi:2,4-dienoyl-CoA reductase-like NADH-dependent reductase (Old Yellow Enzyme family)
MPALRDPLLVNGHRLPSRLVMAPMVTARAEGNRAGDAVVDWYSRRAGTGLGLVVVESTAVAADALLVERQLGAWDDAHVPGLARVAGAIHAHGVPAVVQLVHGGARAHRPDEAVPRVAPSAVRVLPGPPPVALDEAGIARLVDDFVAAARHVVAAGFDGVEIHAAHYYLLSQFLSGYTNRRDDRFGGNLAGRAHLLLEVTRQVRTEIGPDRLLLVRMHCVEPVADGLSTAEAAKVAAWLEGAGVDIIDASGIGRAAVLKDSGSTYLFTSSAPQAKAPVAAYAPFAAELKKAVRIPVIAVGKLADHEVAQRVLDLGQADLVAVGRQLIADPDAAAKMLAGASADLVRCEECMGCYGSIRGGPVVCTVNPKP